jgi:NADP-dependent 3-hydroxy acid dehydrogenase YdfG
MSAFSGRLAVVSGASAGIGRACALALAAAGADLLLLGRDEGRLRDATAAARDQPSAGAATYLAADLTEDRAAREVGRLAATLGDAAILVHSSGIYDRGALADAAIEALDRQYRANIRAPYRLTQALLPQLVRRQGDIVFINSTQGLAAAPEIGQFAATQHAMRAVADALRGEINDAGVRVMTLHAGRTATPRQARIFSGEGRDYRPELLMQPEDVAAMVATTLALPRSAEVTSIAMRPMRRG